MSDIDLGPTSSPSRTAEVAEPAGSSVAPFRSAPVPSGSTVPVAGLALARSSGSAVSDPLGGTAVPDDVEAVLRRRRGRGVPLPVPLRHRFADEIGVPLDEVRVHHDAEAQTVSRAVAATAFTTGSDIYFSAGAYAPETSAGQRLLAHELAHVAQQHSAGVSTNGTRTIGRADDPAERDADAVADRVVGALRRQRARSDVTSTGSPRQPRAGVDALRRRAEARPADAGVLRRTVVQSDWLKFTHTGESTSIGSEKVNIEHAPKRWDRWEPVNDSSDGGYRDEATAKLGSTDILGCLAKFEIIEAPAGTQSPYARAHLIAASFGGQLKFAPADNIRFHPRTLEYGDWQWAETKVEQTGTEGYLTVTSRESGDTRVRSMARQIVDLFRADLHEQDVARVDAEVADALRCVEWVPSFVEFDYTDMDGPRSLVRSWDDQDAGLRIRGDADKGDAIAALLEARVPLPAYLVGTQPDSFVIRSRDDLIRLLATYLPRKRIATVLAALNPLLSNARVSKEAFATRLSKLPEIDAEHITITVEDGGDLRTSGPIAVTDVFA